MFTELYEALTSFTSLWSQESDGTIKPTDDSPVELVDLKTKNLNVNDLFSVDEDGKVISQAFAALVGQQNKLVVSPLGELLPKIESWMAYVFIEASGSLTTANFAVYAKAESAVVELTLPSAENNAGAAILVRKYAGNYSVLVSKTGTDAIVIDSRASASLSLPGIGDWVILRAVQIDLLWRWMVEARSSSITLSGESAKVIGFMDNDGVLNIANDYILAGSITENIELGLPEAATVGPVVIPVRKITSNSYAVTIVRAGSDVIDFDGSISTGITASETGSELVLKADPEKNKWFVVYGGINWSLI